VLPLSPGDEPIPGWEVWQYNGKPYQVSPGFAAEFKAATSEGGISAFFNYFNPFGTSADEIMNDFQERARSWERSYAEYAGTANAQSNFQERNTDNRAAAAAGFERAMRAPDVLMTAGSLGAFALESAAARAG
jgi:hypothetical protein